MILPLPEQYPIEQEIHRLFENNREALETCSRYLRRGSSNLSRQINPNDKSRPNPFYTVLEILWSLDCFNPALADALWAVLQRERERWRVNCPDSQTNSAKLLCKIVDEFKEVMDADLNSASDEVKEIETMQLRDAVDEKLNSIKRRRAAKVGMAQALAEK